MKVLHRERLQGVNPRLVSFVDECARRFEWDVLVVQGFRTEAQQKQLWDQGRGSPGRIVTHAEHAADTPHGRGAAVDLAPVVGGKILWDELNYFIQLSEVAKQFGLVWGGDFTNLKDLDHFEMPNFRSLPFPSDDEPTQPGGSTS